MLGCLWFSKRRSEVVGKEMAWDKLVEGKKLGESGLKPVDLGELLSCLSVRLERTGTGEYEEIFRVWMAYHGDRYSWNDLLK